MKVDPREVQVIYNECRTLLNMAGSKVNDFARLLDAVLLEGTELEATIQKQAKALGEIGQVMAGNQKEVAQQGHNGQETGDRERVGPPGPTGTAKT